MFNRISGKTDKLVQEYDIANLLKEVMRCEARDKLKYKKIINMIQDGDMRKRIKQICTDEKRHYETLQKLYYQITYDFIEIPEPDDIEKKDLRQILKRCIDEEVESAAVYRQVLKLLPDYRIKDIVYEIITDEQAHAADLMDMIGKIEEDKIMVSSSRMPVNASPSEIKYKNKNIDVNLRIPVFSGISNKNIQQQINNSVESDIMEFKQQMEDAAQEGSEAAKTQGKNFIPYAISTNYAVTYDKNNILSLSVIYHEYINGRNAYIKTSYNFDTSTGKALGLGDLFRPGVQYKDIIDFEIRRQLQQNKESYFPNAAQNFKGIASDQPFYLENDNIVVYFGFNQIAPTAAEIPVIRIPLSTFRNQLKPGLIN